MVLRERKHTAQDISSDDNDNRNTFKGLYILIFSKTATKETLTWIIDLLSRSQQDGGAELLVQVSEIDSQETVIEIGASTIRLLEAAEALEITKKDKNGNIREFIFSSLDLFLKPGTNMDNLLNTAEKQRIIHEEIMGIKSMEKKLLNGYSDITLFPGQSIIQVCKLNGIITDMYPLHEPTELEILKTKWTFKTFPLGDIKNYFGVSVAFYFEFICFYNWALIPPAIVGAFQTIISFDITRSHIFFAVFKMIWLTLFLECWKRRSNELAYSWGTLGLVNIPKLHPTFRGLHMEIDPITKQHVPVYPAYRRHFKVYCVSLPLVILCLIFATVVMLVYFQVEENVINFFDDDSFLSWIIVQVPGIIYAILVYVMNVIYSYAANILTEWENHKTQDSFDNHRIVKLILSARLLAVNVIIKYAQTSMFEFVNNFISMGYIAFYLQDLNMLKWQIAVMMVINHLINQFQEAVLPFLLHKYNQMLRKKSSPQISSRLKAILEQREMWSYEGTYDDYLEVFTQFGYVFLFSSVFPLAAVLAVFNNVIEVWMDGLKLCYSYQRPHARPVKGIGVWQVAFEIMSLLSVMSNCALISMSPIIRSFAPDMSLPSWLLIAVVVEHVIIAVKMMLAYLISDVPKWVKVAIQKSQYESLQALKFERKQKTKQMLNSMKLSNTEKME